MEADPYVGLIPHIQNLACVVMTCTTVHYNYYVPNYQAIRLQQSQDRGSINTSDHVKLYTIGALKCM